MKVKRQKQNRRIVRFYKTCYGFHEPFKVLCDGNFVHKTLTSPPLGNVEESLSKVLGSHLKAMVTRCVTSELRRLGPAFNTTTKVALRMHLAKCMHEKPVLAADCIRAMISESKGEHFFVASQDLELRKHLRKVPGVGLVFAKRDTVVLEPPSDASQNAARTVETKRLGVTDEERRLIEERETRKERLRALQEAAATREGLVLPRRGQEPSSHLLEVAVKRVLAAEAETSGREENVTVGADDAAGKALEEKVKEVLAAALKRKRPRRPQGPNPLSMKKKKKELKEKGGSSAGGMKAPPDAKNVAANGQSTRRRRRKGQGGVQKLEGS
eukprot:TRINITY_DN4243_c0_g1_i1.p1 TRINITY_DN4243_c0_g1~~TRINITY_DN4243_c0_g1_i1.p1  ORF type:complete len:327 (-),score=81.75 TRINITY_DN4243_c0_g1_i1:466-1446(-)